MVALVTLDDTKARLRIESNDDDATITGYIEAASSGVINYLKSQAAAVIGLDEDGDLPDDAEVPELIQTATIMLVGYFYRNPDGDPDKEFDPGYLPAPVISLLYPLRDPALA